MPPGDAAGPVDMTFCLRAGWSGGRRLLRDFPP
jgi:hypothetical protein